MNKEIKNAWSRDVANSKFMDIVFILACMGMIAVLIFEAEGMESKIENKEQIKIKNKTYTCEEK